MNSLPLSAPDQASKVRRTPLLDAALRFAELGYPVFPCVPGAKRPLTANGFNDATTDVAQIEAWWTTTPDANVAIATAGLLVVDVDTLPDGSPNPWLADDPDKRLELAAAPMALTPRGGKHYVFKQPAGANLRNSNSKLADKVDTRAEGGYILAAPSQVGGKPYKWANPLDVPREQLPEPPAWLIELLEGGSRGNLASVRGDGPQQANKIPEGQRNDTLIRLGCSMRHKGMSFEAIRAALHAENSARCVPPLPGSEVDAIAASAARYEADQLAVAVVENHAAQDGLTKCLNRNNEPVLVCLADVEPSDVSWLWPGRIPFGRITLLAGHAGLGKSFLTCDWAARITTATPWPDGTECPKGSVVLISAEDDPADTIRPRLDAHYADVQKVHLLSAVRYFDRDGQHERIVTLADLDEIESAIKRFDDCKLLVVDPIGSYLGGRVDAHRDNEVRSVLAPIARIAERYGPAVLVVAHRPKGTAGRADDLVLGSRAFTAIARAVWHLSHDPVNKSRRLLLPGKNNLAPEGTGLAFSIVGKPGRIAWERDPVGMTADDALAAENANRKPGPDAEAQTGAVEWLREALAAGPRLAKELMDEWRNGQGGSKRTLERAKQHLDVEAYRAEVPGPWRWKLPGKDATPSKGGELGDLGGLAESPAVLTNSEAVNHKDAKLQGLGDVGCRHAAERQPCQAAPSRRRRACSRPLAS